MIFENQYLTYDEYTSLGGEQIGEMPFNLLEFEARKQIDLPTHNRLVGINKIPQEVKLCMFNLIRRYAAEAVLSNVRLQHFLFGVAGRQTVLPKSYIWCKI